MRSLATAAATMMAVSLLSGCGGDGNAAVATPAPASPQQTIAVASVQQYAGLVNSSIKDMRETWQTYDDELCLVDDSEFVCSASAITLSAQADALVSKLRGAGKPGVPAFIGAPPPEIARLVDETMVAAEGVQLSIGEAGQVVGKPGDLMFAVSELMAEFDKWEPYI